MATPRVVILGCGFGGLWAAQALRKAPVELTVVDRTNHHLFTPLLYQVATAGLAAPEISGPIRHILAGQRNVTVLMGEARSVDVSGRAVVLDRKSTRLNSSHTVISYAVFCLKKKKKREGGHVRMQIYQ